MPLPGDDLWGKFERAWREWYAQSVKHESAEKRAENAHYYDAGKEHIVAGTGWTVQEIEHTGSIRYHKPSRWELPGDTPDDPERVLSYEIASV